ncbi:MAG: hypothetical protein V1735_06910 [Nanoarchaeota archaeon]
MGKHFIFPERVQTLGDRSRLNVKSDIADILASHGGDPVLTPVTDGQIILGLFPVSAFMAWYHSGGKDVRASTHYRQYSNVKGKRISITRGIPGFELGTTVRTLASEGLDYILIVPESVYQSFSPDQAQRVYELVRNRGIARR